jgi:hypothetical protein
MLSENLLNKYKAAVQDKIRNLQAELTIYDGFLPRLLGFTVDGMDEAEIDLDETPSNEAGKLVRKYATKPGVEVIALIFMADTVTIEPGDNIPADISKDHNKVESIFAYFYTKEKSEYRRVLYAKKSDNNYWYGDEGWKPIDSITGHYANPFLN